MISRIVLLAIPLLLLLGANSRCVLQTDDDDDPPPKQQQQDVAPAQRTPGQTGTPAPQ